MASQRQTRSTRGATLAPLNDNIDRVGRGARTGGSTGTRRPGRGRGRGGRQRGGSNRDGHASASQHSGNQTAQDAEVASHEQQDDGDLSSAQRQQQTQSQSEQQQIPHPSEQEQQQQQQQQTELTEKDASKVDGLTNGQNQPSMQDGSASASGEQAQARAPTGDEKQHTQGNERQQSRGADATGRGESEKDAQEGSSKRVRSSEGEGEEGSSKKQKTDDNKDGETGEEGSGKGKGKDDGKEGSSGGLQQSNQAPEKGPCDRLRDSVASLREAFPTTWRAASANPVRQGVQVESDNIFRAIASVTEAISENGPQFSLIDDSSFQLAGAADSVVSPRIARTGQEMLIPWTRDRHNSLFILRRRSTGEFDMRLLDSANTYGHRVRLEDHFRAVQRTLTNAQWAGLEGDERLPDCCNEDSAARQRNGWACGLHVIFNAWAYALGLRLSTGLPPPEDFITTGLDLVRYAIQGNLDSNTITDFFECYDFIAPDQEVASDRQFNHTVDLSDMDALADRVRRLVTAEATERLRRAWRSPSGVDYDTALAAVRGLAGDDFDVTTTSADTLAEFFKEAQALETAGSGISSHGAQRDQTSDEEDEATQRALAESLGVPMAQSQTSGQSGEASASTAQQTSAQTSGETTNDNYSSGLQNGGSGAPTQQNNSSSGPQDGGSGASAQQHTTQPNMNGPNITGDPSTPGDFDSDDDEELDLGPDHVPGTTALLNSLRANNPEMIPGTEEYEVRQRQRDEEQERQRQAAQRHVDAAQASAARLATGSSAPASGQQPLGQGEDAGVASDGDETKVQGPATGDQEPETGNGDFEEDAGPQNAGTPEDLFDEDFDLDDFYNNDN